MGLRRLFSILRVSRPPMLIEVLGWSLLLGAAIGVCFTSVLLFLDVAGLMQLIAQSREPYLPLGLLYVMNALTFASVTMGATIMSLPMERS